jgi:hypothetical protein
MRIYLTVIDDTPEAESALRFAARRAVKTGGAVHVLALLPRQEFIAFGGVQAAIEEEQRRHAEGVVTRAAGTLLEESGLRPSITVREGDGPKVIREVLAETPGVVALVLGAAAGSAPGALVAHFAAEAGSLPVPLMIVPGGLDREAIDRVS